MPDTYDHCKLHSPYPGDHHDLGQPIAGQFLTPFYLDYGDLARHDCVRDDGSSKCALQNRSDARQPVDDDSNRAAHAQQEW